MSDETLYRVRKPRPGLDVWNAAELDAAKFHRYACNKPKCEHTPRGEWYCTNQDCVVRQVEITCKLFGKTIPEMKCPACSTVLKFHHFTEEEALVPVAGV